MATIFITEKPSVAEEYGKVLEIGDKSKSKGYLEGYSPYLKTNVIITWAIGHLIHICDPEKQNEEWEKWSSETLPMIPNKFKYEVISKVASQSLHQK